MSTQSNNASIKKVAIQGICSLKGALYGVLCENIENCMMRLFTNGNINWYKNSTSKGCISILSIKLSSLKKTKTTISFQLTDICGYEYLIKCKENQDLKNWYDSILNILQLTLNKCPKRDDNELEKKEDDDISYDNDMKYQTEILQLKNYIEKIKEEYQYKFDYVNEKNSNLFDDLLSEQAKNKELEINNQNLEVKCKKLEKQTNDNFPDWWCANETYFHNKNQSIWRWCDENNNYQPYTNHISSKFDEVPVGNYMRVFINKSLYLLRKETETEGSQTNVYTHTKRHIKNYGGENNFHYVKMHCANRNLIQGALSMVRFSIDDVIVGNPSGFMIQNSELYLKHKYLENLWRKNKRCKNINVKYLFHGADFATITKICSNGFNRIFNKRSMYGKGVYFARDADYSIDYATEYTDSDGDKYKFLLYCRVICGDYSVGTKNQIIPKSKQKSKLLEETMVDDLDDPSIFVTTMDNQAYPLVLIKIPVC